MLDSLIFVGVIGFFMLLGVEGSAFLIFVLLPFIALANAYPSAAGWIIAVSAACVFLWHMTGKIGHWRHR